VPLSTAALERAGIHVAVKDLEDLVNAAVEQALPPYAPVDARRALPPAELAFFRDAGVALDELAPLAAGTETPELRTAARYAGLLASALPVQEAARRLGVDGSRVRQRLADHTLYGIRMGNAWRLPLFQFTDDGTGVVPHFGELAPALVGLHPVDVATWFTTPHVDLVVGAVANAATGEDVRVSPRDWLLGGGDVRLLLPLVEELRGGA
jgi:excisionase family DNA binding protein